MIFRSGFFFGGGFIYVWLQKIFTDFVVLVICHLPSAKVVGGNLYGGA